MKEHPHEDNIIGGKNRSWGGCVCRWRLTLKRVHLLLLPFIYYLLCFHTTGEKTSSQPAGAKEEEKGMECHVSRKWKWCNRERPTKTASEGGITSLRLITGQKLGWRHFRCAGILYFQSYVLWGAVEVEVQWACWSGRFFLFKAKGERCHKGTQNGSYSQTLSVIWPKLDLACLSGKTFEL